MNIKNTLFAGFALLLSWPIFGKGNSASKPCELQVYTYQSFVSKWGPGEELKASFEKTHSCTVHWVIADDAMSLFSRLLLEGPKNAADVVLGLDSLLLAEVKKHALMLPYRPQLSDKLLKAARFADDFTLIPYSLGYFAIMYDSRKIKPYPSWQSLLADAGADKKLLLQDPRTSSIGFGLLVWLKDVFPGRYSEVIKQLQSKILTTSKGWSEAYGLFMKGEAPMVLSYTLSEAYHRDELKDKSPYRYMEFKEGHLAQIESMGIGKNTKNLAKAQKFIDHMLSPESQRLIASKGWMYPVVEGVEIAAVCNAVKIPERIISAEVKAFPQDFRAQWTRQWLDLVTSKK
jgi:thiamine transport system substrate-binding protein